MKTPVFEFGPFFAHLSDQGGVTPVEITEEFWTSGTENLPNGRLVSLIKTSDSWSNWEMHPNGEELIYQISGEIELILERDSVEEAVVLPSRHFFIVPKGIWHTANARGPSEALFITLGNGTEHRDR